MTRALLFVVLLLTMGCAEQPNTAATNQLAIAAVENPSTMQTVTNKLIYIGDPMCSWCYGIAPELACLKDATANLAQFELIVGGLRPNESVPMDAELKEFLRHHWQDVHKASGQRFSYNILERNDFVYNTEPACRAVVTARMLKPGSEFAFFKAVQEAFYLQNADPHLVETYYPICDANGISREAFAAKWPTEALKQATLRDFQKAAQLGVRSFPTVVVQTADSLQLLAAGYARCKPMLERFETATTH